MRRLSIAKTITLGAMCAALGLLCLYAAAVLPTGRIAAYFLSSVLVMIGGQAIGMRSMSLYELNADYVLYAKLLGIRDRKIVRYVFRNAVLPQITGLASSIGGAVGGALIVETVFSYPGIGMLINLSIRNVDYTLLSGCTLMTSACVLAANFLVELVYGVLDPRVRSAHSEEG